MNPGTAGGGAVTRVGDDCLFMMSTHVAHDCLIGDGVIMANNATLAGHVEIGDQAVLGGLCAVHQHVRIGRGAMIGGLAGVVADVIPYGSVIGERAHLAGLNLVGLKRRSAGRDAIHGLRAAFAEMFEGDGTLQERARAALERHAGNPLVRGGRRLHRRRIGAVVHRAGLRRAWPTASRIVAGRGGAAAADRRGLRAARAALPRRRASKASTSTGWTGIRCWPRRSSGPGGCSPRCAPPAAAR